MDWCVSAATLAVVSDVGRKYSPLNTVVTNRVPVNLTNFTRDFLTPMTLYMATAILCTIPRTFSIRLGLLPVILWTAFRASVTLDFASGWSVERDRMVYLNQGLVVCAL